MIHINKDLTDAPISLKPATNHFFQNGSIPNESQRTHDVRKKMVAEGLYSKDADSLYKAPDVKEKLENLYHSKCAYCEQEIEEYHVEHYRPKRGLHTKDTKKYRQHNGYPWLSLSWDNLMLACDKCNEKKGNKFDILGDEIPIKDIPQNDSEWQDIHNLSAKHDATEVPLLLNPERCNPDHHLDFNRDGSIISLSDRGKYTIETCDLNRKYLRDKRRKIVDCLVKRFAGIFGENKDAATTQDNINREIQSFIYDSYDEEQPFLMFRRKMIDRIEELEEEAQTSNRHDIQ